MNDLKYSLLILSAFAVGIVIYILAIKRHYYIGAGLLLLIIFLTVQIYKHIK